MPKNEPGAFYRQNHSPSPSICSITGHRQGEPSDLSGYTVLKGASGDSDMGLKASSVAWRGRQKLYLVATGSINLRWGNNGEKSTALLSLDLLNWDSTKYLKWRCIAGVGYTRHFVISLKKANDAAPAAKELRTSSPASCSKQPVFQTPYLTLKRCRKKNKKESLFFGTTSICFISVLNCMLIVLN